MTIAELQALALTIKNEVNPGANTAVRIGEMFQALITTLDERTVIPYNQLNPDFYFSTWIYSSTPTEASLNAQRIRFCPFKTYLDLNIRSLGFQNGSSTDGSDVKLAIYSTTTLGEPDQRITPVLQSALGSGNNYQELAYAPVEPLVAGSYFLAIICDTANPIVGGVVNSNLFTSTDTVTGSIIAKAQHSAFFISHSSFNLPVDAQALVIVGDNNIYNLILRRD